MSQVAEEFLRSTDFICGYRWPAEIAQGNLMGEGVIAYPMA
jgi:hypothetical protein